MFLKKRRDLCESFEVSKVRLGTLKRTGVTRRERNANRGLSLRVRWRATRVRVVSVREDCAYEWSIAGPPGSGFESEAARSNLTGAEVTVVLTSVGESQQRTATFRFCDLGYSRIGVCKSG